MSAGGLCKRLAADATATVQMHRQREGRTSAKHVASAQVSALATCFDKDKDQRWPVGRFGDPRATARVRGVVQRVHDSWVRVAWRADTNSARSRRRGTSRRNT